MLVYTPGSGISDTPHPVEEVSSNIFCSGTPAPPVKPEITVPVPQIVQDSPIAKPMCINFRKVDSAKVARVVPRRNASAMKEISKTK